MIISLFISFVNIWQISTPYMNISCMSDFGAPINPYLVVGDYDGKDYLQAKMLNFIFVIDNSLDPEVRETERKRIAAFRTFPGRHK